MCLGLKPRLGRFRDVQRPKSSPKHSFKIQVTIHKFVRHNGSSFSSNSGLSRDRKYIFKVKKIKFFDEEGLKKGSCVAGPPQGSFLGGGGAKMRHKLNMAVIPFN